MRGQFQAWGGLGPFRTWDRVGSCTLCPPIGGIGVSQRSELHLGGDPITLWPRGTRPGATPGPWGSVTAPCSVSCFANKGSNASLQPCPGGTSRLWGGWGCSKLGRGGSAKSRAQTGHWGAPKLAQGATNPSLRHRDHLGGAEGSREPDPAVPQPTWGGGTPQFQGPLLLPNLPSPCRCARRTWGATPPPWISPRP